MIRRLFKTGNSIVLSLPREALDALTLQDGSNVEMEIDRSRGCLVITPTPQASMNYGITPEFAHQVNEFIAEYRPALEELAK